MTDPYAELDIAYASSRRPEPRIASQIRTALDDARTVVGGGAGSDEPAARE